ncbi:MAG: 5-(carboxyamino)imidazole ribonucleotide synthase [Hyphomicrobiales bacterium]|nr:5-(carboxyamino)imidazole ribonucleotide synthase [Hyphomicrobiales bacterium]
MTAEPLPPGATVGIVGGGQLGRMMALAASKIGLKSSIFAPDEDCPAFEVATFRHCAAYDDRAALERFAREADAVTYEFENVPAEALAIIEQHSHLAPNRRALEVSQNRLEERRFLAGLGLPCAPHAEIRGRNELEPAWSNLTAGQSDTLLFLKLARYGYDGKGQMRIGGAGDLAPARQWLGNEEALLERGVDFAYEFSMLCVRDQGGRMSCYDPPRNVHKGGILRESIVPAALPDDVLATAKDIAGEILAALDYVGVLAVEMFAERHNGGIRPIINEIAPRVHNSGHWTLDACPVSQFENHIRAVAGWPLGTTERHSDARMVNLLGEEALRWPSLLEENPSRSLTLYGKKDAVSGRKMGHFVELKPKP